MEREGAIEQRLQRWAQWVTVGDTSGFPTMSVLHENWSPPSGTVTPTMRVSDLSDVRATHAAIRSLSQRLANTVVVCYCFKHTTAEQAARLDCAERTVRARVLQAHRLIARWLEEKGFCKLPMSG